MIGYLKPVALPKNMRCLARSYLCSLCNLIKEEYGLRYSFLAGPALVFFNIYLDAAAAQSPGIERGGCILLPQRIGRFKLRSRTEHARFTAAFGVVMMVAKLRDDVDDGGGVLRWLLWRLFAPGAIRARAALTELGFDVAELDAWMTRQAEVERSDALPIEDAAAPTVGIGRLLFARAAGTAGPAIGEAVGRFLFYLDNLVDFFDDLESRQYNALARALGIDRVPERMPPAVATLGLGGAQAQVEALATLVARLPASAHRDFVERVVLHGFSARLRRYEQLAIAEGRRPTFAQLASRPRPWGARLRTLWVRAVSVAWPSMRMAFFLGVLLVAPRSAWAAAWVTRLITGAAGPDQTDGGPIDDGAPAGDPVLPGDAVVGDDGDNACFRFCGWCWDFLTGESDCGDCFGDCCGNVCDSVCDSACGSACSTSDATN
jgi:hypothetical protein